MTIVTAEVSDITGRPDNTRWEFLTPVRVREGSVEGSIITNRTRLVQPLDGSIRVELDPGPATIKYDGNEWEVTIPEEDSSLWDIISAAVAVPPDTALAMIGSAVSAWLQENPPSGDIEVDNISDAGTVGAEVVKATTQAAARTAIGAGTSNLTIGTSGSTAKAGNWVPAVADLSDASAWVEDALTGTPAEALAALELGVSGGVGDGTTDDRAALAAADAAAVAAGVPLRITKGVYRIASTLALNSPVSMHPSAFFKVDATATLTLNQEWWNRPGLRQVFDVSSGGKARVRTTAASGAIPDWWGAAGDATTDDATALRIIFNDNIVAFGGGGVHIPAGKTYASTLPVDVKNNTVVTGGGTLKCLAFHSAGMFIQYKNAVKNVAWDGPTVDINGIENMNGHAIGDVPNTTDFVDSIWIRGKVVGTRIDKELEAFNTYLGDVPVLYGGGGKGFTVQFRARNVYINGMTEDCDIACSVEAAVSDDRWLENIVIDLQAKDSHRTALFIGGSRDTISSADSASYMHSKFPGVKVRLRAQGGQDGLMYSPTSGLIDGDNWSNAGVVTFNYASGVDVEVYAATVNRCTLVRGMAAGSTIRITNALMDELQDVWDTRPLDTLTPAGSVMSDNTFEAKVHAATHHGVLVRPHRTSGSPAMQRATVDVDVWCQNGVGAITQVDGTTDGFGPGVKFEFNDMKAEKFLQGVSASAPIPQWSQAQTGVVTILGAVHAGGYVNSPSVVVTAGGTTTLDVESPSLWRFTGSTTQTVVLPTTSILTGQCYTFVNQSSGTVAIQSANTNGIMSLLPGRFVTLMAAIDTPVASTDWYLAQAVVTSGSGTAMTGTVNMRDTNGNAFADNFTALSSSTATSGGTLTLDANSRQTQILTGSSNHTVVLPTSSILAGQQFTIINSSSGVVTVNSSAAGLVASLAAGESKLVYALQATPTTAAHWRVI